jgi:hypothetical protein
MMPTYSPSFAAVEAAAAEVAEVAVVVVVGAVEARAAEATAAAEAAGTPVVVAATTFRIAQAVVLWTAVAPQRTRHPAARDRRRVTAIGTIGRTTK